MSRCGYSDDDDCCSVAPPEFWRTAVFNAIHGARGQKFLGELIAALDSMPDKELIQHELTDGQGGYCALGVISAARGVDTHGIDEEDCDRIARVLGIAQALVREVMYVNDVEYAASSPGERWALVRGWVARQIDGPEE